MPDKKKALKKPGAAAVIEISSNNVRMIIAEKSGDGGLRALDFMESPLSIGKDTFTVGKLSFEKIGAACKAAGLPVSKRFHSLRRSLATSMVNAGVSIYDVAQTLGDKNIDSTKPYIAVDLPHLKLCALPFDGIAPNGGDA